jgi:hypothetical protein
MMLCDISVVFNSFADALGLMNRKRAGKCLQAFNPAQSHRSILPSFHIAAGALGAVLMSACAVRRAGSR